MYEWFKVFHIVAVIAWMAAMLYLPRLLVYHADSQIGSEKSNTFKIMERRLLEAIMTPSMIVTWVFGLLLAWHGSSYSEGWFVTKFFLVILMTAQHGFCAVWVKDFARDERKRSAKFFRIMNEIPTVLMILIVILVVLKPF